MYDVFLRKMKQDLTNEEDFKKNLYTWYSWNLDVFHLCCHQCQRGRLLAWMLMILLWEYCRALTCCIHDYVCHWCQHSNESMKDNRVVDYDCCIKDNRLIIYWCIVGDMYYSMSWSWGSMRRTWIDSLQKILMIYRE